jgi:hypothetical protein
MARDKAGEQILDAGAGRDFHRFFRAACDFFEAAEEKDLYADGRDYGAHGRIVTRSALHG